jgi:hypothetical protein
MNSSMQADNRKTRSPSALRSFSGLIIRILMKLKIEIENQNHRRRTRREERVGGGSDSVDSHSVIQVSPRHRRCGPAVPRVRSMAAWGH